MGGLTNLRPNHGQPPRGTTELVPDKRKGILAGALFVLLFVSVLAVSTIIAAPPASASTDSQIRLAVAQWWGNANADPCADFYDYACGNYQRWNSQPTRYVHCPRHAHSYSAHTSAPGISSLTCVFQCPVSDAEKCSGHECGHAADSKRLGLVRGYVLPPSVFLARRVTALTRCRLQGGASFRASPLKLGFETSTFTPSSTRSTTRSGAPVAERSSRMTLSPSPSPLPLGKSTSAAPPSTVAPFPHTAPACRLTRRCTPCTSTTAMIADTIDTINAWIVDVGIDVWFLDAGTGLTALFENQTVANQTLHDQIDDLVSSAPPPPTPLSPRAPPPTPLLFLSSARPVAHTPRRDIIARGFRIPRTRICSRRGSSKRSSGGWRPPSRCSTRPSFVQWGCGTPPAPRPAATK